MKHMYVVYVNGYGVPKERCDANYDRYLKVVEQELRRFVAQGVHPLLVLAGGYTNTDRLDMSEAQFMRDRLMTDDAKDLTRRLDIHLIEGMSVDENFSALRAFLIDHGSSVLTMFCEWSRQDYFRIRAHQMFADATIHPVIFDRGHDPRWNIRLQQLTKLPWRLLRPRNGDSVTRSVNPEFPRSP